MPLNIKNFYNHTDTTLDFELELAVIGKPNACILVNGVQQNLKNSIRCELQLTSDIDVEIELKNKDYSADTESAVVVKDISVDGYSLINKYIDSVEYANDHKWKEPTTHIGFNGLWKLFIPGPYYISKHHKTGQGWLIYPA